MVDPKSIGIIDCGVGPHIVTANWQQLDSDNTEGFRQLTFRNESGNSDIRWGVMGTNGVVKSGGPFLQADESWTLGPDAGTVYTAEVYIKGTAGNHVTWNGIKV